MKTLLLLIVVFACRHNALADGFSFAHAVKSEKHIELTLTPEQIDLVGCQRRLVLTEGQKTILRSHDLRPPSQLGVESPSDPDCSCHIASAMWIETKKVIIWTDRLKYDREGSKSYYERHQVQDTYVMNAEGAIFHRGRPFSLERFMKLARSRGVSAPLSQVLLYPGQAPEIWLVHPPEVPRQRLLRQLAAAAPGNLFGRQ